MKLFGRFPHFADHFFGSWSEAFVTHLKIPGYLLSEASPLSIQ